MRYESNVSSRDIFYTDSNGREMIKRVRDFRPSWKLDVTEPVSGNYYPLTAAMYIKVRFSSLPDTDGALASSDHANYDWGAAPGILRKLQRSAGPLPRPCLQSQCRDVCIYPCSTRFRRLFRIP